MQNALVIPLKNWVKESHFSRLLPNKLYNYLVNYVDFEEASTKVIDTGSQFNIKLYEDNSCSAIINIKRINDIMNIGEFLRIVNNKLNFEGHFILCAETHNQRKERLEKKFRKLTFSIYYPADFIFKRIFPKFKLTKKIYFALTNGWNRTLSETEILGRLVATGFEILDIKVIDGLSYYVTRKMRTINRLPCSSNGFIFKMKRTGKEGKSFFVYKFRTMHPYSEYLQEYVFEKNNLQKGGKFRNDFRITKWGRFLRKYWIDELPMIINVLKGDMKLVGVRPLSKQYLNLYDKKLIEKRFKVKPGLLPPFYADNPRSLEEIMKSEMDYLVEYDQNHFLTDLKYFFRILTNILFKNARSC